jgi:hypothetical protein
LNEGYKYYDFFYDGDCGGNVLIETLSAAAPEPSTWAMMGLGFAGLGFAGYRKAKEARMAFADA